MRLKISGKVDDAFDVPFYKAMKKIMKIFTLLSDSFRKRLLQGKDFILFLVVHCDCLSVDAHIDTLFCVNSQ